MKKYIVLLISVFMFEVFFTTSTALATMAPQNENQEKTNTLIETNVNISEFQGISLST